jgi:transcriptional regulator with XRE-family HTH domain
MTGEPSADPTPADLRALREQHGITQTQTAELLRLPSPAAGGRVTVSRWETGAQPMAPMVVWALRWRLISSEQSAPKERLRELSIDNRHP